MIQKTFALILWTALGASSSFAAPQAPILWSTREEVTGDVVVYLDIDRVMHEEGLSRLEAIEVQNHLIQIARDRPATPLDSVYEESLARVRGGWLESGWKPVQFLDPADFVVALDMDEVLLQQFYDSWEDGFFDLMGVAPDTMETFTHSFFSPGYVKFAPGAEELIRRLHAHPHCKGIVVYSAKRKAAVLDILARWTFSDGQPAIEFLSGVLTRTHLALTPRGEYSTPSKDLRILDPSLRHVVLLDDNAGRVPEQARWNLIHMERFNADSLRSKLRMGFTVNRFTQALPQAANQIEIASLEASAKGISFAQALKPFSYAAKKDEFLCKFALLPESKK